jgi:carbon-monoxide dehydrogenase medium subunit
MFTRPFEYRRAETLSQASALLRELGEDAKVIAGGQSLLPLINLGLAQPAVVVDISRAGGEGEQAEPGGDGVREITVGEGYLTAGALVTHARLAADPVAARAQPLLGAAAQRVGNARVRNRGTLGGSLAHSDPAAELPLAMVALGGQYRVSDGQHSRVIRAEEFHLGFLATPLEPDELVCSARVPVLGPGWGWGFHEFARRDGDFAVAAAAALARTADGVIVEARVAVSGVAGRPTRLGGVESALSGARPGEVPQRVEELRGLEPAAAAGMSAAYRARLARVLVTRAVTDACRRAGEVP